MLFLNYFVTVQASRNHSEMLMLFWGEGNKEGLWAQLLKEHVTSTYPPTSLHQWLATLYTSQSGRAMWEEDKKSTGEACLDKIITEMQLIFCFQPINFSTLPLTLQIWLFNQLERNSMAGCMLPCLLCFCLNLSHSFVAQSSEGRGRQREKRDSPREHLWSSHTGRDHCLIGLEQFFTCSELFLSGNSTSKF